MRVKRLTLPTVIALASLGLFSAPSRAGLYNPAEPPIVAEPEPQKFLSQLSDLRGYGPPDPLSGGQPSERRLDYLAKAKRLQESQGPLSASETASLGAYLIRLRRTAPGMQDFDEALRVLENGRRQHRGDFAILANLATVYQLTGRLDAAESCLQDALEYAPREVGSLERYQLTLVRQRQNEVTAFGLAPLDRLFVGRDRQPLRFVGPSGQWEVGRLADAERKKLPGESVTEALRVVQQLLVWFPDDARLLWLFGELANAAGDVKTAANALEQAVYVFRLSTPELKEHRLLLQEAVAWREVLKHAGTEDQQQAWLLAALSRAVPGAPSLDLTPSAVDQAVDLPLPREPSFRIPGSSGASEAPAPVNPFANMGWQGWTAIAVAALFIVGLLALQVRESWRRRSSSRTVPAHE